MQTQDPPQNLEMSLREHLLAAGSTSSSSPYPLPPSAQQGPEHPYQTSDSPSPHDNLDGGSGGQQQAPYAHMSEGDDGSPQSAKGKRELSTSKRAAQNRAAQRAFRQRKEGYIKKLEEQVKEFQSMEHNYKALQSENNQLREYILNLQSRLLETQSDIPPAPSASNLSSLGLGSRSSRPSQSAEQSSSDHARDALSQLQAAAAQASAAQQSPYGLSRTRADEAAGDSNDAKPGQ